MESENKYLETGSNPFHLNTNGTAKEFSVKDNTNPEGGFLDILSKFAFIDDSHIIEVMELEENKNDYPSSASSTGLSLNK